jgi:AcrR family transcriptional regulator
MKPEQRRAMIVAAALPLVVEYGAGVTTAQIARAAGVGEGTIFRAFADKDELLAACMAAALRLDDTLAHLDSVSLDQPLADRLVEAAEALTGYLARMGAVAGALHASGAAPRRYPASTPAGGGYLASVPAGGRDSVSVPAGGRDSVSVPAGGRDSVSVPAGGRDPGSVPVVGRDPASAPPGGREAAMAATGAALAALFEPERANLRLPPEQLGAVFQFLVMSARQAQLSIPELVDLFLHGALGGD